MPKNLRDYLLIDCGATTHMVGSVEKLTQVYSNTPNRTVRVANGTTIPATHRGEMRVPVSAVYKRKTNKFERHATTMILTDVLVVPGLSTDLYSCNSGFYNDGIRTMLNDDRFLQLPDGGRVEFDAGNTRLVFSRQIALE